jgi:dGTPase
MLQKSMHWSKLLNWDRLKEERTWAMAPSRTPWQVDYDRIVFSSAFRRLQDKTQVFPLSDSDYIRTRLTHSLEVSTVARTLGTIAGAVILERHGNEYVMNKDKRERLGEVIKPGDIGAILAAAALAHDLGNPPFGHSGEDAVRHWFETSRKLRAARKRLSPLQRSDMKEWEGNAQGFRILTDLQLYRSEGGGMRLTHSTLATFCKYPTQSLDVLGKKGPASRKKFGVFLSEMKYFQAVANATGLLRKKVGSRFTWCRHPLVFLMEAADDVCYRIVDLEDGYRMGCIQFEAAQNVLLKIATKVDPARLAKIPDEIGKIGYLRAGAINALIEQVTKAFADNEPRMLTGEFNQPLGEIIESHKVLDEIKTLMVEKVYNNKRVLEVEAAGFEIIPGLLDLYWSAVSAGKNQAHSRRALKVRELIPLDFQGPRGKSRERTYERMLRIADYVSGMTDSYALSLYRKLNGIALPS